MNNQKHQIHTEITNQPVKIIHTQWNSNEKPKWLSTMKSFRIECGFGIGLLGAEIIKIHWKTNEKLNRQRNSLAISTNFVNFFDCFERKKKTKKNLREKNTAHKNETMYFHELYLIWKIKKKLKIFTQIKATGKVVIRCINLDWNVLISITVTFSRSCWGDHLQFTWW